MKITVVGLALIVAAVIVALLVLNSLPKNDGGATGIQPPQSPLQNPRTPGA